MRIAARMLSFSVPPAEARVDIQAPMPVFRLIGLDFAAAAKPVHPMYILDPAPAHNFPEDSMVNRSASAVAYCTAT